MEAKQNGIQKGWAPILVIGLLIATAAAAALFVWTAHQAGGRAVRAGQIDVSDCRRGDMRMLFLDGDWEVFPGQLIISGEGSGVPELAPVPHGGPVMPEGRASYRLTFIGLGQDVQLMVAFPGLMCDYQIFVDGKPSEVYSVTPNYLQFVVMRGGKNHELVLEICGGGTVGLDICPVAMDVNELFRWVFGVRSAHLTFLGMLIFAFVVFPVLYARGNIAVRKLKLYFLTSALALLFYIGQTVWFYGVLDIVGKLIPLSAIPVLNILLATGIELTMLWHICTAWPEGASHKGAMAVAGAVLAAIAAALACRLWLYPAAEGPLLALSILLTAGSLISTMIRCYRRGISPPLIYVAGDLALLIGMAASFLSGYRFVSSPEMLILPAAMVLFLLCWNLAVAQYRQDEVALLQDALDLEQRMLKTQGAFLASQIQPHFLYNTLTTIQELCWSDPELAADTVLHFANYLRQNIDFMDYKDKIPFEEELRHMDSYIQIQRARFEDAVDFVLDIGVEHFMLPPLTVQPLMENAVSHGIRRGSGRGTVRVSTRQEGNWVTIRVADNGAGFDTAQMENRSLENIRSRLALTMHGSMTVRSSPGAGTEVTLHIPYEEAGSGENCDCG